MEESSKTVDTSPSSFFSVQEKALTTEANETVVRQVEAKITDKILFLRQCLLTLDSEYDEEQEAYDSPEQHQKYQAAIKKAKEILAVNPALATIVPTFDSDDLLTKSIPTFEWALQFNIPDIHRLLLSSMKVSKKIRLRLKFLISLRAFEKEKVRAMIKQDKRLATSVLYFDGLAGQQFEGRSAFNIIMGDSNILMCDLIKNYLPEEQQKQADLMIAIMWNCLCVTTESICNSDLLLKPWLESDETDKPLEQHIHELETYSPLQWIAYYDNTRLRDDVLSNFESKQNQTAIKQLENMQTYYDWHLVDVYFNFEKKVEKEGDAFSWDARDVYAVRSLGSAQLRMPKVPALLMTSKYSWPLQNNMNEHKLKDIQLPNEWSLLGKYFYAARGAHRLSLWGVYLCTGVVLPLRPTSRSSNIVFGPQRRDSHEFQVLRHKALYHREKYTPKLKSPADDNQSSAQVVTLGNK